MTNTQTTRIARVHIAEVEARSSYGPDSWGTPSFRDDVTKIRLYGRHQGHVLTWSILYVGPEGACRRVQNGPVLPGPYAALIPDSVCISARRFAGDNPGLQELSEGDLVVIRGVAFRIDDSRGRSGHDPELVPVTA
jgi:hypothetical protein